MNSKNYQTTVDETKNKIIEEINKIVEELSIPGEIDYVELPIRIRIETSLGEELDDSIFGVRKNEAIINSMFNPTTPNLNSFSVELLIKILNEVKKYKDENY